MSEPLLVEWYRELPEFRLTDDPDLWGAGMQQALRTFRVRVRMRYSEGTLQRMLAIDDAVVRRAAVLALGAVGGMGSNAALAQMLHDPDAAVARLAADSMWEVWFRGSSEKQARALQRAATLPDMGQALAALDVLIREAPDFAEACNQRAILLFRKGEFARSLRDCETVLRLNPFHFGAQAGMGQCYLKLHKPRAALRAFRLAIEINPTTAGIVDTIRKLEENLSEGESRGDHLEG